MGAEAVRRLARAARRHAEGLRALGADAIPVAGPRQAGSARHRTGATAGQGKQERLADLAERVRACRRCPLYKTRTHPVISDGAAAARLVFIGEAPGRDEDLQGVPFVGRAGQLLTRMIQAMGLARQDVYICNVLKDRPPGNRTPLPEEMEACVPFLQEQVRIVQPRVICVLGAVAAKALLGPHVSISRIRGQQFTYEGIPLIPTFHPAYLLRNPAAKKDAWEDLQKVMALLSEDR